MGLPVVTRSVISPPSSARVAPSPSGSPPIRRGRRQAINRDGWDSSAHVGSLAVAPSIENDQPPTPLSARIGVAPSGVITRPFGNTRSRGGDLGPTVRPYEDQLPLVRGRTPPRPIGISYPPGVGVRHPTTMSLHAAWAAARGEVGVDAREPSASARHNTRSSIPTTRSLPSGSQPRPDGCEHIGAPLDRAVGRHRADCAIADVG